jgi:hypothetical protein
MAHDDCPSTVGPRQPGDHDARRREPPASTSCTTRRCWQDAKITHLKVIVDVLAILRQIGLA